MADRSSFTQRTASSSRRHTEQLVQERFIVLEPNRTERNYWAEFWHYRELFAILAWRDIGTLQANGDWCRLGHCTAPPDGGRVHHHLR